MAEKSGKVNKGILYLVFEITAVVVASILLYALNPLKGLSWTIIFIMQAFAIFAVSYFGIGGKEKPAFYTNEFRIIVIRHTIAQLILLFVECLAGFIVGHFLGEKAGWVVFVICMVATVVSHIVGPKYYTFWHVNKPSKIQKFLIKHDYYIYAFLVTVTILLLLFAIYSVYPFGDQVYLRMDCYHQYAPFLREFYSKMHNGESLLFAWENGLGVNYWAHFCYYLSSPTNFLLLLLPENHILEGITATLIIKGGLGSVTFLYYLDHRWKRKDIMSMVFGIFYGLSAFYLAYSCNIMWNDCYILFPLIMLGVEKIAKGESARLYGLAMGLCIFSNYYIAAIAGLATVLYFLVTLIVYRSRGHVAIKLLRFFATTIVVCLLAGVILVPSAYCILNTQAGDFQSALTWKSYFGFHELFSRMLINADTIQNNSSLPNIFASLLAFFLLPLYFCNPKISLDRKITKGLLLLFLLFSFQWNILTYVWHGLHFPNSFPARQSFFYIFLLLSMTYECYDKRAHIRKVPIIVTTAVLSVGTGVLWVLLSRHDLLNGITSYLCSITLILFYGMVMFLSKDMSSRALKAVLLGVAIVEISVNTLAVGINSTVDRTEYLKDADVTQATITYMNNKSGEFYRVEEPNRRFMNEGAWDGYNSASYFSSTISGGVMHFYESMGLRHSDVAYSYQGSTPLMTSFLGVKYLISPTKIYPGDTFTEKMVTYQGQTEYVYENLYPLSVGFCVSPEVEDRFDYTEKKKPFTNMEHFYEALIESRNFSAEEEYSPLFQRIVPAEKTEKKTYVYGEDGENSVTGMATVYKIYAGMHPYFYVTQFIDNMRVVTLNEEGETIESHLESDLKFRHIVDLGEYPYDRYVAFISESDPETELTFQAYCFLEEPYKQVMEQLASDQLLINEVTDGGLKGAITCKQDEVLLFTIPYDEGFTVWIDGNECDTWAFMDAFLATSITKGEHKVEIRYMPPGLSLGIILSIVGAFFAVLLLILSFKGGKTTTDVVEKEAAPETGKQEEPAAPSEDAPSEDAQAEDAQAEDAPAEDAQAEAQQEIITESEDIKE
jgi:uncharacterized membrane protein YfhO